MIGLLLLGWATVAALASSESSGGSRKVNVDLRATWNATSLVHEAAEWLGDSASAADPAKFYAFAEAMMPGSASTGQSEGREDVCWTRLHAAMDGLVDGQLRQVSKVALASRQYSPRLETFRQLSEASDPGEGACCWAVLNGETVVTDPRLVADGLLELKRGDGNGKDGKERVLDIDHLWGATARDTHARRRATGAPTVALYGPMDSACSAAMHGAIVRAIGAQDSYHILYVWRPIPFRPGACEDVSSCSTLGAGGPLVIPGYGVELALKSTEYNAQDAKARESGAEVSTVELTNPDKLEIRLDDFADIGKHVLEKIAASDDGLGTLKAISEDFPNMVDAIAEVPLSEGTTEAVERLAASVVQDAKLLIINGVAMDPQDVSWHEILETIRTESEFMQALHDIGVSSEAVSALVAKRVAKRAGAVDFRLDYRAAVGGEVLWMNDIETDPMFVDAPSELQTMLEVDFMGQRPPVRRNVFTGVMLVDVSTRAGASAIATASELLRQGFPAKLGVVPVTRAGGDGHRDKDGDGGLATAFVATALGSSPRVAADVFVGAATRIPKHAWRSEDAYAVALRANLAADPRVVSLANAAGDTDNEHSATAAYLKRAAAAIESLGVDLGESFGEEDDAEEGEGANNDDGGNHPRVNGALLMNGAVHTASSASMWRSMFVNAWQVESEVVARLIQDGTLVDASTDLLGDILEARGAVPRLNPRIIKKRTDLSGVDATVEDPHVDLHVRDVQAALEAIRATDITYVHGGDKDVSVTHWIFIDSEKETDPLADPLVEEAKKAAKAGLLTSSRVGVMALDSPLAGVLGIAGDGPGVVTNGRFLSNRFGDITSDDFLLLQRVAQMEMFADDSLLEALKDNVSKYLQETPRSDLAVVVSMIMTQYSGSRQVQPEAVALLDRAPPVTKVVAPSKFSSTFPTAPLRIRSLFSPLSPAGQQLAPILAFLHDWFHADIEVVLNVEPVYADLPLKSYYRFVTPDMEAVATTKTMQSLNHALVPGLPLQDILTLGMDVPEPWLVSAVRSKHDLDNIQLSNVEEMDVEATYQLDHVLVTGMALDVGRMTHPRGVQLEISRGDTVTDTLVMSNLGYFQLKANPGIWELRLAEGASREIYHVKDLKDFLDAGVVRDGGDGGNGGDGEADGIVAVTSFTGRHMMLAVERNEGQGGRDVLDGASGHAATGGSNENDEDDDDRIHVFTVASGHMYERLQSIMIAGAVKRSSRRIKFWFLSDVISPDYRDILDVYADQYGFDYELVTYRWPTWLRKQTEKQRKIWAYKILFLDTLFPTRLRRVLFIDSDSTVRGDLAEAWDMDLQGAPYAYTPMCNGEDGDEMDAYRFWKRGFWEEHLKGRPYHISAFYIVDLQRFRALAAGDRLRVAYDQLSRDPGSLANLDQDLPNFVSTMPSGIPIHSLGPEWLWCDSWCDLGARSQAKVIDLCNNPLTREPKLESARRLVAEWPSLHDEVEEFTKRARGWLNGSISREQLEDQSYRVTLTSVEENPVVDNVDHDEL